MSCYNDWLILGRSRSTGKRGLPGTERGSFTSATIMDLNADASPLPQERTHNFTAFPEISVDLPPGKIPNIAFTRESINAALGGSKNGLLVRYVLHSESYSLRTANLV